MKENRSLTRLFSLFLVMLLSTFSALAQHFTVSGVVTDGKTGESLIGVSILEKGTTNGTITDLNGEFTLKVAPQSKLVITYIGYKPQEKTITESKRLDIIMVTDDLSLDEVVVVGYGIQKKSVVTAAISKVTGDELNVARPSRVEDALKGKVSGVQITQSSGQPGADSKVRIRGIGTVNNSDPLYIVDGMPVDGEIGRAHV